jgi:hypothetical protein
MGYDFLNFDFLNLPKIVEAIYGSICTIFHAKSFPSISNGGIFRSITQSTLKKSIPSKFPWNEKKKNFNKQTTNLLLSTSIFVIRRAPPQVVAPNFNVKMSSNPIIWLIEQPPAPLSCKTFLMKKYKQNMTSKLIQFGWVKLIVELMSIIR